MSSYICPITLFSCRDQTGTAFEGCCSASKHHVLYHSSCPVWSVVKLWIPLRTLLLCARPGQPLTKNSSNQSHPNPHCCNVKDHRCSCQSVGSCPTPPVDHHNATAVCCRDQAWTAFDQEQQQPEPPKSTLLQYEGPPLQLHESWQIEVLGSKVLRAGLVGAVRWAAPEAKALSGSTPFRLQVNHL
eukprot:GHUV01020603.1.p1 GENE.GHUV01020603.1~~GHUV01020603.1.p1  ORF type:complete len:186 (+),score=36.10 GHUV01020603.1:623-1180(+)